MILSYSGEFGLPNALRERLLTLGMGKGALILDAVLFAGLRPGRDYTLHQIVVQLRRYSVFTPLQLIRNGLNSGLFGRGKKISGRGRPLALYRVPFPEKLLGTYGIEKWMATDQLGAPDLESLKLYRQALHREFIRRRPGSYSRAFLSSRLGIGKRTTRNYDRALGVIVEQQFKREKLEYYNWKSKVGKAIPHKQWLEVTYWRTGEMKRFPAKTYLAQREQEQGGILTLVTQKTSYYCFVDGLQPTESQMPY